MHTHTLINNVVAFCEYEEEAVEMCTREINTAHDRLNTIIIGIFIECKDRKNHEKTNKTLINIRPLFFRLGIFYAAHAYQSIYLIGLKYEICT